MQEEKENQMKKDNYYFYVNNTVLNKTLPHLKYNIKNMISTTKYNAFTFLPKALFYQYMRISNIYFLITAILSCIKVISPLSSGVSLIPVVLVLAVSLIKELIEDIMKYKLDIEQNNEKVDVYDNEKKCFKTVTSGQLNLGEIVKIYQDQTFPCDIIIIDSSFQEGICYIETGSLDGEKFLKTKKANSLTIGLFNKGLNNIQGILQTNKPNSLLYHFVGKMNLTTVKNNSNHNNYNIKNNKIINLNNFNVNNIQINSKNIINNSNNNCKNDINNSNNNSKNDIINSNNSKNAIIINNNDSKNIINNSNNNEKKLKSVHNKTTIKAETLQKEIIVPLNSNQLLLKGAKLKNTKYIIGIITYTGNNCKIMLNSKKPRNKFSTVEKMMNKLLVVIFIFQCNLCILSAILHKYYYNKNLNFNSRTNVNYINGTEFSNITIDSLMNFFCYLLLFQTMIPISLIVTLEIVRGIQALFLYWDIYSFSTIRQRHLQPHSINLNEELGLVDYVFTDKTGTLTCNKMKFKFCVIGENLYEYVDTKIRKKSRNKMTLRNSNSNNSNLDNKSLNYGSLDRIKVSHNLLINLNNDDILDNLNILKSKDKILAFSSNNVNSNLQKEKNAYTNIFKKGKIAQNINQDNSENNCICSNNDLTSIDNSREIISFTDGDMYLWTSVPNITRKINMANFIMPKEDKYPINNNQEIIIEFWKALALCHDCSISIDDKNNLNYIGCSPDNIELVNAAKNQGFKFVTNPWNKLSIKRIQFGKKERNLFMDYEVLHHFEFSSERKKESIIVKEKININASYPFLLSNFAKKKSNSLYINTNSNYNNNNNNILNCSINSNFNETTTLIKLYIKGADNIIEDILDKESIMNNKILFKNKKYINLYSALGYRTLFVAMKIFTPEEYKHFSKLLSEANLILSEEEKEKKINNILNQFIENGVYLLGTTIVEDKLQDKVNETIKELQLANIKIWMLTGDKMSTAFNIAKSCNLITKNIQCFFIKGIEIKRDSKLNILNIDEIEQVINNFAKEFNEFILECKDKTLQPYAIIVDEQALLTLKNNNQIKRMFLSIAKDALSVICCRVSPIMKSEVVKMIKEYTDNKKITLAIGDGNNDASMILESHIGIGIYGEEGMRAVQCSDYAIGEFKILKRLILHHGYSNYIRISEMILYFFYKNFVFSIVHLFYGFDNNFSGQTIIDDYYIAMYNLVFTGFPLGARACLDFYLIGDNDGIIIQKLFPFLYMENRDKRPIFTTTTFILNLIKGIIHGVIDYYFVYFSVKKSPIDENGNYCDLWFISLIVYTNILLIVNFDIFANTKYHTWINFIIMFFFSFILYAIFLYIVDIGTFWIFIFNSEHIMKISFSSPIFYLNIFLVSCSCFLFDIGVNTYSFNFTDNLRNYLTVLVNKYGKINDVTHFNNSKAQNLLSKYDDYEKGNDIDLDKNSNEKLSVFFSNAGDINNKNSDIVNINTNKNIESNQNINPKLQYNNYLEVKNYNLYSNMNSNNSNNCGKLENKN